MSKLKLCPFCGKEPRESYCTSEWWPKDKKEHTVECVNNDCLFIVTTGCKTREEAIKAWNRRTNE